MAELLAPAGNPEALDAAINEGADAVYMGLRSFNARMRSTNFAWNQFEAAVQSVHKLGKKIFVTVNTVIEEKELERLYRFLNYLDKIGPDGLIVQDFGVVRMIQEFFPNLRIHASTQMNVASSYAANLLAKEGVKRVVLARELGFDEIKKIRENTSVELETFVHGALCVSESGLCLFSSYLGGKSANRGQCTQACRRFYNATTDSGDTTGYYFSPLDLQLIEKIPDLIKAGVNSFKIEGRMKSAEYVGSVTRAYRYVMDHWQEDKKGAIATGKRMLSTDFARAKTQYWYLADKNGNFDADNLLNPKQPGGTGIYLGKIDRIQTELVKDISEKNTVKTETDTAKLSGEKNQEVNRRIFASLTGGNYEPEAGDSIRLHKKDDTGRVSHKIKYTRDNMIDIPEGFSKGDEVYLLQTKSMSKRYPHVLPNDLSRFRQQPGAQILPVLDLTQIKKDDLSFFPDGIYVQVSTIRDMHFLLSESPVRFILELNSETSKALVEKKEKLPVSKKCVFISLDPYVPEAEAGKLDDAITELVRDGYTNFVVNNPAHIQILKTAFAENAPKAKPGIIAGPYLYTFNRWAVSWLENQDIEAFIMSAEDSCENLENTFEKNHRKQVLIPLLSWPALFRMRFKLPQSYNFSTFTDKEGLEFTTLSTPNGSYVFPAKPFSIIDKYSTLQALGFTHFLLDFSHISVNKSETKIIFRSLYKGEFLPETSRFNWKDGFYDPEKIEAWKSAEERGTNLYQNRNKNSRSKHNSSRNKSQTKSGFQSSSKGRRKTKRN
jgi:putative protease